MKQIILAVFLVGLFYLIWQTFVQKFDRSFIGSAGEPKSLIILKKGMKYKDRDSIYWYTSESSIIGSPSDLIAISNNFSSITAESAIIRGEFIIDVTVSNDTIVIASSIPVHVLDSSFAVRNIMK